MNLIQTIKLYFGNYIKENKVYIISYFIALIIFSIVETFGISYLLNKITPSKKDIKYFYYLILYFIIIIIVNHIINYLTNYISTDATQNSRTYFFQTIINKYSSSYKDIKIGDIINRIMNSTLEMKFFLLELGTQTIPQIIVMFSIVGIIFFSVNKILALILFICLLSSFILIYFEGNKIILLKAQQEEQFYQVMDDLSNKYNNLLNTYINNENENEKIKIKQKQDDYGKICKEAQNKNLCLSTYLYIILAISILICMYIYIHTKIFNSKLLFIVIIYFIIYFMTFFKDLRMVLSCYGISLGSSDFLKELTNYHDKQKYNPIQSGSIQIRNLSFGYNKKKILNNLNLTIKNKEKIALIGKSGSGKTTLSKLLINLHPYEGNIFIDNKNIKQINNTTLRNNIIYINQRTVLFERSVVENMMYGNNYSKNDVIHFLNKYDLKNIFDNLPNDIHENVRVNGGNLSLGML
jgi:ABC-type multidrug transport system fused ATPase/permease subunit